jgi:hypothetical protein
MDVVHCGRIGGAPLGRIHGPCIGAPIDGRRFLPIMGADAMTLGAPVFG